MLKRVTASSVTSVSGGTGQPRARKSSGVSAVPACDDVGDPRLVLRRRAHAEIGEAERLGDARAHELAERDAGALLAERRDHPHARARVVLEARARLPVEAPAREARAQRRARRPVAHAGGRVREARRVREELLDARRPPSRSPRTRGAMSATRSSSASLPSSITCHAGGRRDRLACTRRSCNVESSLAAPIVRSRAASLPCRATASWHDGQDALAHLALGALEEARELRGIEAEGLGGGGRGLRASWREAYRNCASASARR